MVLTTRLRVLRLRHGISLTELASRAGISNQHLSRLELGGVKATPAQEKKIADAVGTLISDRRTALLTLEGDFLLHSGRLLEPMEVQEDGQ